MKFLRCTIGLKEYGPGCMKETGVCPPRQASERGIPQPKPLYFFEDTRLLEDVRSKEKKMQQQAHEIDEYLTLLSVCHTVMLSYDGCEENHVHNQAGCQTRTRFNAQSPDELALVDFALDQQYFFHHIEPCKFDFRGRTIQGNRLIVNIQGEQHNFDCFEVIEFTSTRKRCSVIVYDERDDKVKIYCKGADNVVRERLTPESIAASWLATNAHLQKFASIGLRTLCCAYRVIPEEEFLDWYDLMQSAKSSMVNRAEAIAQASEQIEVGFTLLGTTAIEDRLQEGVPEAIASLAEAGIKIWVLTGDKVEVS
jgi:magnesium-transporting ATPase (P-type)